MENYRKIIKQRLLAMGLFTMSCGIIYLVGGASGLFDEYEPDGIFGDFFSGVQIGFILTFSFLCVFYLGTYITALNSEKILKEMYIKETDERSVKISELAGVGLQKTVCFPLLFSAIIAGYFSAEVFFTLFAVVLFISLVTAARMIYFKKIM